MQLSSLGKAHRDNNRNRLPSIILFAAATVSPHANHRRGRKE